MANEDEFIPDEEFVPDPEFKPEAPRLSGHERQRNYLEALRAGSPELAAGHSMMAPGPDLSSERRTAEQNLSDWAEVGKGAAKAVPATIAGGLVGDVEGLGRTGINLVGSNPVVPFSVDPHTVVPTTEEGGYLGPRGLGIMEASTTALERAGSFVGSMVGPGAAVKGARAAGEAATALRAIPETVRIHPEAPVGAVRTESGARLLPTETPHVLPAEVRAASQGPTHAGVGAEGAFGPLMDVRPEAINHLRKVLREDGWTPHTLEARLEEMSPHQSLFELSPNLEDRAQKLAVAPGASRNEMANFLRTRQAETQDRLRSTFDRAFGEPIDVAQELRTISIDQRRAASPLYREFETLRVHPTAEIQALMPRLRGLEGTARRLAQLEGQPFDQTFFVGGPNKVWPTARSWDQIKQAIDAKIEGSFTNFGEATKWTRAYTQLKNDLINAIEAPSQGRVGEVYREARRAFAEPAAIKSATRMGERLLNASIRADELPFLTAAYSEAEMNALRQGLRAHLEDRLGRPGRVERKMINDILAPNNERKIRWVVGDEAADELLRGIRYEHEMWDSPQRIIGGSPTGARVGENPYLNKPGLLDETTAGDLIETLAHPVKTGLKRGAEMFTKRKMFEKSRRAREAKLNQYREDLSRLFTAQGPERDAIVRWLFDTMDEAPRARGGRVDRNRGGMARLANNKAMKAKRLHGTPFKQWTDAVGRAEGGPVKLSFTPEGYPYYDNPAEGPEPPGAGGFSEAVEVPEDTKPIGLAAQQDPVGLSERRPEPAPEDPFERAAIRQRRGVAGGRQPTEAVNVGLGSEIEEKPDWMLEPMLEQQQKGEFVPEGMKPEETAIDEFGRLINKQTFEPIKMIERPGMLPLVGTPRGVEFAMPKILDVAGYLGGGWGAKVPVRGAETVLGAGPTRRSLFTGTRPIKTVAETPESGRIAPTAESAVRTEEHNMAKKQGEVTNLPATIPVQDGNLPELPQPKPSKLLAELEKKPPPLETDRRSFLRGAASLISNARRLKLLSGKIPEQIKSVAKRPYGDREVDFDLLDSIQKKYATDFLESYYDTELNQKMAKSLWDKNEDFSRIDRKTVLFGMGPLRHTAQEMIDFFFEMERKRAEFVREKGWHPEGSPYRKKEPLQRQVLERGRSGRPIRTQPISAADDQAILEQGAETALRANPAPQFFSALERAVNNAKLNKATPDQWLGYLRNQPGVKAEELERVRPLEGAQGHLTKQQLQTAIAERKVRLEETKLSHNPEARHWEDYPEEVSGPAKYQEYQLPGGTNYRELLLRMPERIPEQTRKQHQLFKDGQMMAVGDERAADRWRQRDPNADVRVVDIPDTRVAADSPYVKMNYQSGHWDEPNVLAHVRMNDRDIPGVGRSLHLEEIQSDWHQAGRKRGYKEIGKFENLDDLLSKNREELSNLIEKIRTDNNLLSVREAIAQGLSHEERAALVEKRQNLYESNPRYKELLQEQSRLESERAKAAGTVPDAPFKSTWPDLALKRMIREAAEKNYDAISWTPGKAQAERYPETLRQAVSEISWENKKSSEAERAEIIKRVGGYEINPLSHRGYEGDEALFPTEQAARDWLHQKSNERIPPGTKSVTAVPRAGGRPLTFTVNKDGIIIDASASQAKGKEIEELFGKDMAKRIMSEGEGNIEAKDFVIGGHGMEAFYDQMLVNKANALGKKYGARVEVKRIWTGAPESEEGIRQASRQERNPNFTNVVVMKLTPAMKRAALREGFPLFSGAPLPTGAVQDRQERKAGGRVQPTEAQKEAGNYKKDHLTIHGLNIAIENRAGSQRTGTDKGGKRWSVRMPAAYGYIKGSVGADKDHVDCYIGPNPASGKVFIVNQLDATTGKFDEHKCMLGFATRKQAENTYLRGFSDGKGKQRMGHVTEADIAEFKDWLNNGNTTKPVKRSEA